MVSTFERLLEAAGCESDRELADFLGVRLSFVTEARRNQRIKAEWLLTVLRRSGVNPTGS